MSRSLTVHDEVTARFVASTQLPTQFGTFQLHGFDVGGSENIALSYGDIHGEKPVLTRIHSECLTGDALYSLRCDCGKQLETAMEAIVREGCGVILYLRQEGRGIGLLNKLRAYALQDKGLDTVDANIELGFPADARDYRVCKPMLDHLGVKQIRLMTNNPKKLDALNQLGFNVLEHVPHRAGACLDNERYLATKAARFGHLL